MDFSKRRKFLSTRIWRVGVEGVLSLFRKEEFKGLNQYSRPLTENGTFHCKYKDPDFYVYRNPTVIRRMVSVTRLEKSLKRSFFSLHRIELPYTSTWKKILHYPSLPNLQSTCDVPTIRSLCWVSVFNRQIKWPY